MIWSPNKLHMETFKSTSRTVAGAIFDPRQRRKWGGAFLTEYLIDGKLNLKWEKQIKIGQRRNAACLWLIWISRLKTIHFLQIGGRNTTVEYIIDLDC